MTQLAGQQAPSTRPAAGVRPCRICGAVIRVVTDVYTRKPVAIDAPAAGVDRVYPWWDAGPAGLQGRASEAWLWAALQQAPPAAAAMSALGVEVDAPALAALESLGGFGVDHRATCRGRETALAMDVEGLAALCRYVAAELRGPMTRAKAGELAGRLEAAAGGKVAL